MWARELSVLNCIARGIFVALLGSALPAFAQGPRDFKISDPGDLASARPDGPTPKSSDASIVPSDRRDVTWRQLPKNFLHDQKDMWLFPVRAAEGHHWLPTLLVAGGTAALIAMDPQTEPHFRKLDAFQDTSGPLNAKVSGGILAGIPATFYVVGLLRHNPYDQATSLFAGEAVADDAILVVVMKAITRRDRPSDRPVSGPYNDTFFQSGSGPVGKGSSFPSGHALMSFSVATVFARRYPQHKWVPWVAYGLATAISFSRLTTGAHFPSDVLFGAAAGYAIARFDVLHNH